MHIQVLRDCHNAPSAGHMGTQKTLDRVRQEAYWTNMARDVDMHCRECEECQKSKLPIPTRAPLVNVPVGRPWQMVAIDILEVPLSNRNNRYLLVVQDYFTKWPEAIPIPDQTAARITKEMVKLFCMYGIPDIVHSDQGRNFESTIFRQTLAAFGTKKSHTTAYHPEGDGMVERLNRSLLQLLRTYAQRQDDWEKHLPLVLYAYRTSTHSSTGTSPFQLMYGRQPKSCTFSSFTGYDALQYQETLQAKLAELQDLVEAHIVESAKRHKGAYDQKSAERRFKTGDLVWLSIPTAGKLDPRWEGKWKVKIMKSPVTMEITDGKRTKVVHVNRLQPRIQPSVEEDVNSGVQHTQRIEPLHNVQWEAPLVEHLDFGSPPPVANPPTLPPQPVQPEPPPPLPTLPPQEQPGTIEQTTRRYPERNNRRPPNRL